ncbi:unnamed protein product [Dracunculus medinensis]|uniref:PDZ domain-containing protein n=1 Tax=Dracunculus medinensis TaxID=318479 RepID=A0A0N4U563_DRAME|nr:unnamed protein product [Dracunculus medinensis]
MVFCNREFKLSLLNDADYNGNTYNTYILNSKEKGYNSGFDEINPPFLNNNDNFDFVPYEQNNFEVKLKPDSNVVGLLAFQLVGNRTSGVFIRCVDQTSEQSKQLRDGDRISEVCGIDVKKMTCDQIATILRTSLIKNGFVVLKVTAKICKKITQSPKCAIIPNPRMNGESSFMGDCTIKYNKTGQSISECSWESDNLDESFQDYMRLKGLYKRGLVLAQRDLRVLCSVFLAEFSLKSELEYLQQSI